MSTLWQDLCDGVRILLKKPGFTFEQGEIYANSSGSSAPAESLG